MALDHCQHALLDLPPSHARYLVFGIADGGLRGSLLRLRKVVAGVPSVIGFGEPLIQALGGHVEGLRSFPAVTGPGVAFPSTQGAVWAYLPGATPGEVLDRAVAVKDALGESFRVDEEVDAFKYHGGLDLSGFEDGTENPKGEAAVAAAIVQGRGPGLDGGSFVAVQRYRHDLGRFKALSADAQSLVIGRDRASNEELADAPPSAHVKRTAQESFDPPAFMLRRSMPWGGVSDHGLYFVAFVEALERFERVLRRMAGEEDGTVDSLPRYTRPLTGGYYFCPPLCDGVLDTARIGL